jgi:hypothetical protein
MANGALAFLYTLRVQGFSSFFNKKYYHSLKKKKKKKKKKKEEEEEDGKCHFWRLRSKPLGKWQNLNYKMLILENNSEV